MTERRLKANMKNLDKELGECESYMSKFYKGKQQEQKPKVSAVDKKCKTAFVTTPSNKLAAKNQVDVVKNTTGSGAVTTPTTSHPPKQQTQIIRKEVFSNPSATVEVVVKTNKGGTRKRSRSRSRSSGSSQYSVPWSKLLQNKASTENTDKDRSKNTNSFAHFDPMRTLHFLTKELRNKLGHICPSDPGVQQMVVDIEHALNRLPVGAGDKKSLEGYLTNFSNRDNALSSNVSPRSECPTQPTHDYQNTEVMQQHLEESISQLENTCRNLDAQCSQLRMEKAEIMVLYKKEQSSLQELKEKFDSIERQKTALEIKSTTEVLKLQSERDMLQQEIDSLKSKIGSRQSLIDQDSRMLIQQLKTQNSVLEESHMNVLTELTELKMERDKLNVLLESRDSQLEQLRKELLAVQTLIREQLVELKNRTSRDLSSDVSSSTLGDQDGVDKAIDKIVAEAKTKTTTSHAIQEYLIVKNKTIEELSTKAQDMLSKAIAERNRLLGMDLPMSDLTATNPDTVELFHSFNESDRAITDVSSTKSYQERKNKVTEVHTDKDNSSGDKKEKHHHDHDSSLEIITAGAAQLENKRSVRDIMTDIKRQAKQNVEANLRALRSKDMSSYEENSDVWVDASPKIPSEWEH